MMTRWRKARDLDKLVERGKQTHEEAEKIAHNIEPVLEELEYRKSENRIYEAVLRSLRHT